MPLYLSPSPTAAAAPLSDSELRAKRIAALDPVHDKDDQRNGNGNENNTHGVNFSNSEDDPENKDSYAGSPLDLKPSLDDKRPLCRFFLMGSCKYGDECSYRHDVRKEGGIEAARKTILCPYALSGKCRHKERCFFSHELPPTTVGGDDAPNNNTSTENVDTDSGTLGDTDTHAAPSTSCSEESSDASEAEDSSQDQNQDTYLPNGAQADALVEDEEEALPEPEAEEIENTTCGICYDNIIEKGRRFALLSNCQHCFCIDCIRTYHKEKRSPTGNSTTRNGRSSSKQQRELAKHTCAICRQESDFVLPSKNYYRGEEKARKIALFKNERKDVPCRYFKRGKIGTCPFGPECIFAHLSEDGTTDMKPNDIKKSEKEALDMQVGMGGTGVHIETQILEGGQQQQDVNIHAHARALNADGTRVQAVLDALNQSDENEWDNSGPSAEEEEYVSSFLDSLERARPGEEANGTRASSIMRPSSNDVFSSLLSSAASGGNVNNNINNVVGSFFDLSNAGAGTGNSVNNDPLLRSEDHIQVDRLTSNLSMFGLETSHTHALSRPVEEDRTEASDFFDFMERSMRETSAGQDVPVAPAPLPLASLFSQQPPRVDGNPFDSSTDSHDILSIHHLSTTTTVPPPTSFSSSTTATTGFDNNPWGSSSTFSYDNPQLGVANDVRRESTITSFGDDSSDRGRPQLLSASFREALQTLQQNLEEEGNNS